MDIIRPVDVEAVWADLLPVITDLCAMSDDTVPDDVLRACREQRAFFYTVEGGGGFVVVRPTVHPRSGEIGMFVWFGRNWTVDRGLWNACLDALARQIGATYIEFSSRRRGFERTGWQPVATTYRREVA